MTSMLLMLVVLGVFVHSSQAVKCYFCHLGQCDEPKRECTGEICLKATPESGGMFTI